MSSEKDIDVNNNTSQNPQDDEDFLLVQSFIDGNESAFTKLVGRHKEKVRNLVFLTLGDTEFVDDISQDVFISIFHNVKNFRFDSKFTTWLYRITVNKCRDYLRKKRVRSIFVPLKDTDDEPAGSMRTENMDIPRMVAKQLINCPIN